MSSPGHQKVDSDVTRRVAEFAAGRKWEDLPHAVVAKLKLHILDTIGCGLFGATPEWTAILRDTSLRLDHDERCVLWGTSFRASGPVAALVNGTAAHAYELDDMHV